MKINSDRADFSGLDRLPRNRQFVLPAPIAEDGTILVDAVLPTRKKFASMAINSSEVIYGPNKGDRKVTIQAYSGVDPLHMQFVSGGMKTDVPPGLKAFTEPQSKLVFTRSNGAEEWKPDVDPSVVSEECTLALFTNVLGTVVVDKLIERRL